MNNSKFMKIYDTQIHYLEEGAGDPVLFLHGILASSYLWRNIIPVLSTKARCIAPDLVGLGRSDKPDIEYNFFDYLNYSPSFVDQLKLDKITLVVHGLLGSALGFYYMMQNPDKIKGIAFYEAYVRPIESFDMFSLPVQDLLHPLLDNPELAYQTIMENNFLIEKVLPACAVSKLSEETLTNYREPFLSLEGRKPLLQYVQDFFIGKNRVQVLDSISQYSDFLQQSPIPKLMLYTTPGFVTTMDSVTWCEGNLPNLQAVDLEEGLYLAPESNPKIFSNILLDWYNNL
ncbi:MAG: haloalkane dehalogenase [Gammaproteobacteria bacterium]|nr:haloalkane dehalogenase [Gammaproteobacteria bacterium]